MISKALQDLKARTNSAWDQTYAELRQNQSTTGKRSSELQDRLTREKPSLLVEAAELKLAAINGLDSEERRKFKIEIANVASRTRDELRTKISGDCSEFNDKIRIATANMNSSIWNATKEAVQNTRQLFTELNQAINSASHR